MLCISWNAYKFLYSPCSKIKWTQENRLRLLIQQTNSWDQDGLLRGAQEIVERDQQCPKRCVWTDHSLEQYQCDWERSKGDTENHKEKLREPNNFVFRLTHSTSYKKNLKVSQRMRNCGFNVLLCKVVTYALVLVISAKRQKHFWFGHQAYMYLGLKCKQATSTTFRSEWLLATPEHSASKQQKSILWCLVCS